MEGSKFSANRYSLVTDGAATLRCTPMILRSLRWSRPGLRIFNRWPNRSSAPAS